MYDRKPDRIVNPLGKNVEVPVGLVTLTAAGQSVCLSEILERVEQLTAKLEEQLTQQFADLPSATSDMLLAVEIEFGEN